MGRALLVLMLAFGLSVGIVGSAQGGSCTSDDCGFGSEHVPGDADRDTDQCPPFCGGCLRVAAVTAGGASFVTFQPHARSTTSVSSPGRPHAAPPETGLFRPPRT